MRLKFIHGAGGYVDDRDLADSLGAALGADVDIPHIPDGDMSLEAWAVPIRSVLAEMDGEDVLIAHSFGATVVLHVLAERVRSIPARVVLLAMPDWSPAGWGVEDYEFDGPEPGQSISLHHCLDDEVVPIGHLALNSVRLPSARVTEYPSGGHQFDGLAAAIAADAVLKR